MRREDIIRMLEEPDLQFDMVVIGGGASGLGAALDAASRGFRTLLLEQHDFAKGTSSRSTKLVHGGVRYLAQGNLSLVLEALRERGRLKENAPHLVKDQSFIIPCYRWWCIPFYTVGLILYDTLAGRRGVGRSRPVSLQKTIKALPEIRTEGLRGGVRYYDCQFDDARLSVNLVQTLFEQGGIALNYMKVTGLMKEEGRISGVEVTEMEHGRVFRIGSRAVINATGVFADRIIKMEDPLAPDVIKPSQGVHLVMNADFLGGTEALMIPKTTDGRVLFAVPWHRKVVVGTTDVETEEADIEPLPGDDEVEYLLETAAMYMKIAPKKDEVLSVFTGLRPLAAPSREGRSTKEISRGHKVIVSKGGLITLTGGKWTTYRRMGEDVVDRAVKEAGLQRVRSRTRELRIHGNKDRVDFNRSWYWYGADLERIRELVDKDPGMGEVISEDLHIQKVQIIWAIREEYAMTLEDCLSRRIRALQLDARESIRIAPRVAEIMAAELGYGRQWQEKQLEEFRAVALAHLIDSP